LYAQNLNHIFIVSKSNTSTLIDINESSNSLKNYYIDSYNQIYRDLNSSSSKVINDYSNIAYEYDNDYHDYQYYNLTDHQNGQIWKSLNMDIHYKFAIASHVNQNDFIFP